jgi:hypothetical protein
MINLEIIDGSKGSLLYPRISFSPETGMGLIAGESFMDDSKVFYGQIMDWIRDYESEFPGRKFELVLKLNYFNTSTSKMLFDMMLLLADLYATKKEQLHVHWYYPESDPELFDDITDMGLDSGVDINIETM